MSESTVLLLGGTGRTGSLVVRELLDRGAVLRAIVRSARKLTDLVGSSPSLSITEAEVMMMDEREIAPLVEGCDAVVSCLGHLLNLRGIYGRPRDLCTGAVARLIGAIEAAHSPSRGKVRLVLMSSVSVNPPAPEAIRGGFERAVLALIRTLLPPARDNQRAADLLAGLGPDHPSIEWCAVRPDTLKEGEPKRYSVHPALVNTLFRPADTDIANVAHFMATLATEDEAWNRWKGGFPVIVNDADGDS